MTDLEYKQIKRLRENLQTEVKRLDQMIAEEMYVRHPPTDDIKDIARVSFIEAVKLYRDRRAEDGEFVSLMDARNVLELLRTPTE